MKTNKNMKQQSEIANLPKFSMIVLLLSLLISKFYFLSQFLPFSLIFCCFLDKTFIMMIITWILRAMFKSPMLMPSMTSNASKILFSLHMWTKFGDDWPETATCIAGNVTISFKHEYRRPTLTSRCDVISDVINIKNIFLGLILGGLSISNVKMNISKIFRNFQNGRHFEFRANFWTGSCTGSWWCYEDRPWGVLRCRPLNFCSSLKIDWDMPVFVIFHLSISADVMTLTFDLWPWNWSYKIRSLGHIYLVSIIKKWSFVMKLLWHEGSM